MIAEAIKVFKTAVDAQDNGRNKALIGIAFKGCPATAALLIADEADLNIQHGNVGTALVPAGMFAIFYSCFLLSGSDKLVQDARGHYRF